MRTPKRTELIIICIVLINIAIISIIANVLLFPKSMSSISDKDYEEALKYSVWFYDANKCGKDVSSDNVFDWRGPCHIEDGNDLGLDLSGGFHDGSMHVKYGLTQGYTASILGWSLYLYKDSFIRIKNYEKMLSTLKYFTDYFLKCHINPDTFYFQIGDDIEDYVYMGPSENQTQMRPTVSVADKSHPASDICGQTSAALSLMYLNYKDKDAAYAGKCLAAAKELYAMGRNYRGYGTRFSQYVSGSFYDDLTWAAIWLYQIEQDRSYLNDAEEFILKKNKYNDDPLKSQWTLNWDDVTLACCLKLYELTKKQVYHDAVNYNLNYWLNSVKRTKGGLYYLEKIGVLRYASNESFIAMQWYNATGDKKLKSFAKSQLDYILGANPSKTSFVVGSGKKYPTNFIHRGAYGYDLKKAFEKNSFEKSKHVLYGALVSGPSFEDEFSDSLSNSEQVDIALDFNAGLVGALASILESEK